MQARLFRGQSPADAPLQYAQALDAYREVNLLVDVVPPIAGYDVFDVDPTAGIVDCLDRHGRRRGAGSRRARPTRDRRGPRAGSHGHRPAGGRSGQADPGPPGPGAGRHGRRRGLAPGGPCGRRRDETSNRHPAGGPVGPLRSTPLLDGTARSAVVSVFDGWARIQEALAAAVTIRRPGPPRRSAPRDQALLGDLIGSGGRTSRIPTDVPRSTRSWPWSSSPRSPVATAWRIVRGPSRPRATARRRASSGRSTRSTGSCSRRPTASSTSTRRPGGARSRRWRSRELPARSAWASPTTSSTRVVAAFEGSLDLTGATWTPPPEQPLIPEDTP